MKLKKNNQKQNRNNKKPNRSNNSNRTSITVPYNKGLSESFKNIGRKFGIQVHFKSGKTLKEELEAPKDKDHITKKSGVIYRFKCDRLECVEEYIGEASRTFGERYREHLKAPSPIHDHSDISGHTTSLDNFSIVGREEQNLSRLIKESMYIRVNVPSQNKNIGKFHLPHLWNEVLNNSRELKIVYSVVIPSTTKAITSAYIPTMWLFHLPQGNNISPSHLSCYSTCHKLQKHQPLHDWQ